jgi:Dolichyl-phosphate-mannose-protein mannosyltransferase
MRSAVVRTVSTRARARSAIDAPGGGSAWAATIRRASPALALAAIVLVGGWLRFTGTNWDDGAHLHPDERYLTIVAGQLRWPSSVGAYFDVEHSPLSPYNVEAGQSYLYGTFPLTAAKAAATTTGRDDYARLNLVGRRVSAAVDTTSIVLVFLVGRLLLARRGRRAATVGALLGSAFYALSVLAVQIGHFFTVEAWLVFFTLLAFYVAAVVSGRRHETPVTAASLALFVALGAALGLVAASKVSGLLVALPAALALLLRPAAGLSGVQRALSTAVSVLVVLVGAYVAFRLVSPYAFQHSSWLDVRPSTKLRAALEQQQHAVHGEFLYPPAYQWLLSTPIWDPLRNIVVWGVGLPLGLASIGGLGWMAVDAARRLRAGRPVIELMLVSFVLLVFFYFGSPFAHTIRYLVPILPFLGLAAAYGLVSLHEAAPWLARGAAAGVLAATLLYALAFVQIYRHPNTRVAASRWIHANVPAGSTIVDEHWDDALPVSGGERYHLRELPVFDPDDQTKLRKLHDGLRGADYYVLSSPRAWKTIGRLPSRFPIMVRFYDLLQHGRLGYRQAAQFTSYPRLLGIELRDLDAEEAFWVYDHPVVKIYRRVAPLTWRRFRATMCAGARLPGCS